MEDDRNARVRRVRRGGGRGGGGAWMGSVTRGSHPDGGKHAEEREGPGSSPQGESGDRGREWTEERRGDLDVASIPGGRRVTGWRGWTGGWGEETVVSAGRWVRGAASFVVVSATSWPADQGVCVIVGASHCACAKARTHESTPRRLHASRARTLTLSTPQCRDPHCIRPRRRPRVPTATAGRRVAQAEGGRARAVPA